MTSHRWMEQHAREVDAAMTSVQSQVDTIERWGGVLAERLSSGARLLAAGNGGSAAEAQHLTGELVGRFLDDRRPFAAVSLCSDSSTMTCVVNDYGADELFARQVQGHGRPGDVLVLLSTSGTSSNVLAAADRARECGLTVWGLTGPEPNPLAARCDDAICVDAPTTAAIQEGHLVAIHALCAALDAHLDAAETTAESTGLTSEAAGESIGSTDLSREAVNSDPDPDPRPHVVVVGDLLLDIDVDGSVDRLCPDAPAPVLDVSATRTSPGGAGLAALLCSDRARVTLVAPVAADDQGRRLLQALQERMDVVPLGHEGPTRTKVRLRTDGRSLLRMDEGGPGTPTDVPAAWVRDLLLDADAVLVSDYGAGVTRDPVLRSLLVEAAQTTRLVWDPHPRGGVPVPGVTLATPNLAEARSHSADADGPDAAALALRVAWQADAVCVTSGAEGAFLADRGGQVSYFPAREVAGDPCGAGDRFAASATVALAGGELLSESVESAVAEASEWVAAGGAEGFRRSAEQGPDSGELAAQAQADQIRAEPGASLPREELSALAGRLRADGGRLVATGGCFDIVHAGHVATLQAARRLGDHLVVLMNSDASVSRLKGPGRPVVDAADRARVLQALDCVDAVVVFDEDNPRRALEALRPDVWVKGGDYGGTPLPESDVVSEHGGRVVLLPYLNGRSTTSILRRSAGNRATDTMTTTSTGGDR